MHRATIGARITPELSCATIQHWPHQRAVIGARTKSLRFAFRFVAKSEAFRIPTTVCGGVGDAHGAEHGGPMNEADRPRAGAQRSGKFQRVFFAFLKEGLYYYDSMTRDHGIAPRLEHLASIVNLLARKGETRRAYEFIRSFSMEPSKVVWRCLLSGCKIHKDLVLGRLAAEKILSIDPEDTSAHIMLSNIYAEAKMWDKIAELRILMNEKARKKDTGCSWIESKNKMYSFSSSHSTKFEGVNLNQVLNQLTVHLSDAGYFPHTSFYLSQERA